MPKDQLYLPLLLPLQNGVLAIPGSNENTRETIKLQVVLWLVHDRFLFAFLQEK